jgi:hypothetical protein
MNAKGIALRLCIVAFVVFSFASLAGAQEWHTANQVTIGWDKSDGSTVDPPIPQNEISYRLYLANAITDANKTNPAKIADDVKTLTYTVTLGTPGKYFVGVSAIRTVEGEIVGESEIAWSDTANPPFGVQMFIAPPAPGGLRIQ